MAVPRVVLFTRYPTPGEAKTRLIPALGAEGAAALHRRLTERTLAAVRASALPHEVRVTGAESRAFTDWLGPSRVVAQGDGGLGERLARAAEPYPAIFVGADAPDLNAGHLLAAADALRDGARATLGPAEDGGYWLLGLAEPVPGIFDAISWGSDAVYAETVARLAAAGIAPAILPTLADCDRPEDLRRWPELSG